MGLSRHDRVALVLPNGPEMAVAFLAVAASATCVPLNPAYRANELEAYLTALRAKALIVQAGMNAPARAVAQARGLQIIELSSALEAEAGIFTLAGEKHPCVTPPGCAQPDDIALVMHTSGTTARPRFVPLSHTTICTAAHALCMAYALSESDRLLNVLPLFHSHGLISTTFASLLAGASVVCTSGFDTSRFFAWMAEFRPTWYAAVPTMHQAILACAALHREIIVRCPLRFIRSSSSALPLQVLTELERVFDAPVIEAYGMTEASSIACNPLPPRPRKPGSVGVTIGPEVAIMDETGTLLRAGETGEIVVRGVTVMQGYDNDPLATRSAFMHGWFRTGDQGFLDADGYLFITGRLKEIINRGGEKIAPQEVDDVLMAHPAVAQAVTFAVPDSRLGEDIAAAVVLHPHVAATSRDIRLFAAMHLAHFKVPRQVLIVEDIPKGPTGKLQRLSLAEQLGLLGSDQIQPVMRADYTAPRTPIEEILAALWAQMLEVEHVGIHDDFFQLGGDSLLATQLISRIREALHVEVSLLSFFDTPTVAGLTRIVETANRAEQSQQTLAITPVPRQGPLPATVAQEQLWFLNQILPGLPCSTLYVVRLTGGLNVRALELSFNEIIKRHEALRTAFAVMHGQLVQVIAPTLSVPLKMVDLCPLPEVEREREVQHLTEEEIQRPFDLAQRPLLRLSLLRLGEREHVLLLTIHHIISDGWSISVFAHELTVLYEAFSVDAPSLLPALPIQYADFAYWQRQWPHSEAMAAQLAYWKRQLRDPLPMLHFPTDHPQAAVRSRIADQPLVISGALSKALKSLSHREGCTPFMTLVAASQNAPVWLYGSRRPAGGYYRRQSATAGN
jgi:acyl-CoA synthetase (AMP-forming)/AMP-acid ligase II/acyl carrier protein